MDDGEHTRTHAALLHAVQHILGYTVVDVPAHGVPCISQSAGGVGMRHPSVVEFKVEGSHSRSWFLATQLLNA